VIFSGRRYNCIPREKEGERERERRKRKEKGERERKGLPSIFQLNSTCPKLSESWGFSATI
jgi:hypothetical protein